LSSKEIQLDIRIDDEVGQRIAWLSTVLLNHKTIINEVSCLDFYIEKLNLNKGWYHCTIYIKAQNEVSDWIQNAFSFEVAEGDYYQAGKLIPQNQSKMLIDFKVNYIS